MTDAVVATKLKVKADIRSMAVVAPRDGRLATSGAQR